MNTERFLGGAVTLHVADVLVALAAMPDDCIDCVVTSPPYWGLRDYGVAGQLGLEPTLGEHLTVMVAVFREVRRVLKPSGTLWLNYGDCYASTPNGRSAADTKAAGTDDRTFRDKPFSTVGPIYDPTGGARQGGAKGRKKASPDGRVVAGGYLKPGDLCMVPNRIAIALQEDGWWVKAENIWAKTNPMPDSSGVTRPSASHEKVWLLTKANGVDLWRAKDTGEISGQPDLAERVPLVTTGELGLRWVRLPYFYDAEAVRVRLQPSSEARLSQNVAAQKGSTRAVGKTNGPMRAVGGTRRDKQRGHSRRHAGFNARWDAMPVEEQRANGRFLRCYEPAPLAVWPMSTEAFSEAHFATFPPELAERCILAGCPAGGVVLDPFGGSGTTGMVAAALGRSAVLIELNPEYARLARARIESAFMGLEEGQRHMIKKMGRAVPPGPLFEGVAP